MTRIREDVLFRLSRLLIWQKSFTVIFGGVRMSLQNEGRTAVIFRNVPPDGIIPIVQRQRMRSSFVMRTAHTRDGKNWSRG